MIKNQLLAQTLIDFEGLDFGNKSPTDIDAFLDFNNKLFIFMECKFGDAEVPLGQKIALERLCDATHNPPHRNSFILLIKHDKYQHIYIAKSEITKFRFNKTWYECDPINAKDFIDILVKKYGQ
jgi:hypothetical protein